MAGDPVVVGIDLGTSAVKVLAVTPAGREVAEGSEFYGLVTPQPGFVEQDADVVYRATMRVLRRVVADVRLRGGEVAAIGLSSAMHGVLAVDDDGEPLGPLISWMDRRSSVIADRWRDDGTAAALYRRTGAPMHPMLPLAKLRWLAEHEPERFAGARRFVGLKELFVHRWTGEWLVDWGIAGATGMFDLRARTWNPRALELAELGAERLSEPAPPSTILRSLRPPLVAELGVASGGAALVLASSDGALANIGSGAAADDLAVTLGTSGAARVLSDAPALDSAGRTFCYPADDDRYVVGGATSGAGAALDWLFALLFPEIERPGRFQRAAALAAEVPPGANGCTVLPFLAGERAPYWEGALRGAIVGLDLAHDRGTIVRAALEGVVFGIVAVYTVMRALTGSANRLILSGGLCREPLIRTILTDVFGIPAVEPHQQEASAFGAALFAAQCCGLGGDAVRAARAAGYDAPVLPDAARAPAYAEAFARYRVAVDGALESIGKRPRSS